MLRFIEKACQRLRVFASERRARRLERQARLIEEMRQQFLARTQAQSESDFVAQCFQAPCEEKSRVALAIRNAIAKPGEIEARFVRADASFEFLYLLPFWKELGDVDFDSGFFVELIEKEIEKEMGVKFTNNQLKFISAPDPYLYPETKIKDFISDFYQWYSSLE